MDQQIHTVTCTISRPDMDEVQNYMRFLNMNVEDIAIEDVEDELDVEVWKFTATNDNLEALKCHLSDIEFRIVEQERVDIHLRLTTRQRDEILNFVEARGWNDVVMNDQQQADEENYLRVRVTPVQPMQQGEGIPCDRCLCTPCVTDKANKQLWWANEPETAKWGNNKKRKNCYKAFWTFLYHRGIWALPQYIERKNAIIGGVRTRREIMPDCVVTLVRSWYPNPGDNLYMGHRCA